MSIPDATADGSIRVGSLAAVNPRGQSGIHVRPELMQDDYLSDDPDGAEFGTYGTQQKPGTSKNWALIIGILAGVGLLGVVLCCGIGWYAFRFGTDVMAEQVGADLQDNATIQERIGTIQSISLDFTKSAAKEGNMVFRIEGDKGSGYVTFTSINSAQGTVEVTDGSLRMDSGESFPLALDEAPDPASDDESEQPGAEAEGTDE